MLDGEEAWELIERAIEMGIDVFDTANVYSRGEHETGEVGLPYDEGPGSEGINERVQELAAERGITMAQVALAWHFHKDVVTEPIVGTSSVEHLEEAVEALEVSRSASDVAYLEEPYRPAPIDGHE